MVIELKEVCREISHTESSVSFAKNVENLWFKPFSVKLKFIVTFRCICFHHLSHDFCGCHHCHRRRRHHHHHYHQRRRGHLLHDFYNYFKNNICAKVGSRGWAGGAFE